MNKNFTSEQEEFWAGEFGNDYTQRNKNVYLLSSNIAMFSKILSNSCAKVTSLIEFGSNIGLNLIAIKKLLPECELSAVEINKSAVKELQKLEQVKVYNKSLFDFEIDYQRDFALSKGLLIHLAPEKLKEAYEIIFKSSKKYICLAEYYNPTPVEISYRGHVGKLFKRDFAGEMMDLYKDLKLIDYGFIYHRDSNFPQDDLTWFLLKK